MKHLTILILFAVFIAAVVAQSQGGKPSAQEKAEFKKWMRKYHKKYGSKDEEQDAMMNWLEHKREIDEHNKQHRRGQNSHEMQLFDHSDMSHEEIKHHKTGVIHPDEEARKKLKIKRNDHPDFPAGPKSVDWRKQNLVGPVQSQSKNKKKYWFERKLIVSYRMSRLLDLQLNWRYRRLVKKEEQHHQAFGTELDRLR